MSTRLIQMGSFEFSTRIGEEREEGDDGKGHRITVMEGKGRRFNICGAEREREKMWNCCSTGKRE